MAPPLATPKRAASAYSIAQSAPGVVVIGAVVGRVGMSIVCLVLFTMGVVRSGSHVGALIGTSPSASASGHGPVALILVIVGRGAVHIFSFSRSGSLAFSGITGSFHLGRQFCGLIVNQPFTSMG